jgi:hypothetical protein
VHVVRIRAVSRDVLVKSKIYDANHFPADSRGASAQPQRYSIEEFVVRMSDMTNHYFRHINFVHVGRYAILVPHNCGSRLGWRLSDDFFPSEQLPIPRRIQPVRRFSLIRNRDSCKQMITSADRNSQQAFELAIPPALMSNVEGELGADAAAFAKTNGSANGDSC